MNLLAYICRDPQNSINNDLSNVGPLLAYVPRRTLRDVEFGLLEGVIMPDRSAASSWALRGNNTQARTPAGITGS